MRRHALTGSFLAGAILLTDPAPVRAQEAAGALSEPSRVADTGDGRRRRSSAMAADATAVGGGASREAARAGQIGEGRRGAEAWVTIYRSKPAPRRRAPRRP